MEDETVHVIRDTTRSFLQLSRQRYRDDVSDLNRRMCVMSTTPETIAQKLKTKSISLMDLEILKNGLMDDRNNVNIVLNTYGALRGLVRELTCHSVKKQSAALACLCNLALTEAKGCRAIAKSAGAYLVTTLDNFSSNLTTTCAWTLGNLAGSGPTVCELLITQGALTKLADMLQVGDEELQSAVLYALKHFTYQLKDDLSSEHLATLLRGLTNNDITIWSSRVLFTLSCHKDFPQNVPEDLHYRILADIPQSVKLHIENCKNHQGNDFCCKLINLFRVLANMDTSKVYSVVLDHFVANNLNGEFHQILNFENKTVGNSLLWLLGNLYNHSSEHVFFQSFLSPTFSDIRCVD